ncbi:MAG: NAD(P)-dependent oxidoreductase [Paludibacteraceae bacterium]|nr:NAD(P)-dependent oxidoreductase [Paludibacteraceae bacterium]
MKIALTGITGFVGTSLMSLLRQTDSSNQFLTLNIDVAEAESKYPQAEYPNFTHIHTTELDRLIAFNPDVVMHLATVTTAANNTEIIHPMIAANIEFGVLLLDALQQCDNFKLFVNTGSFAEFRYGAPQYDSAYLYTATKTAFRSFLAYYSSLGKGFKYINAVPYSVYGGQMTVKRLMDYIRESMDSSEAVDMTPGEQILDFVHVDDVAGFFAYVATHVHQVLELADNGQNFYLGTGHGTSIRQLAQMMEAKYGKKCNIRWGGRAYRERDIMKAIAPIEKNAPLEWKAQIRLADGI